MQRGCQVWSQALPPWDNIVEQGCGFQTKQTKEILNERPTLLKLNFNSLHFASQMSPKITKPQTLEGILPTARRNTLGRRNQASLLLLHCGGSRVRCCWNLDGTHTFGNTITRIGDIVQFYVWFMAEGHSTLFWRKRFNVHFGHVQVKCIWNEDIR